MTRRLWISALSELSTKGRLSRSGFFLRHLVGLPIGLFICIATHLILGASADLIPSLLLTLFLISTWSRRLHDRGYSALRLLLVVVPVVGALYLLVVCAFAPSAPSDKWAQPGGLKLDYLKVGN